MFRKSIQPITQNLKIKKRDFFLQLKLKFYCNLCSGRGYIACNKNGKLTYSTCPRCSGVGHISYTYF